VTAASALAASEFNLRQALRTRTYWILALSLFLQLFIMAGFNTHFIPFLTEMNIDPIVAGGMMGIMLILSIPSRLLGGFFADRVAKDRMKILLALPFILLIIGMTAFLVVPSIRSVYFLLFFYGIAQGLPTPLVIISISRYFGREAFGSISGTGIMFRSPAAFIAPVLAGWIFDTTGSYSAALILFALAAFIAVMLLSFLKTPEKQKLLHSGK
jgi:cyanate permease